MKWHNRPHWQRSGIVVLCLYIILQVIAALAWAVILKTNINLSCTLANESTVCFPFWWSLVFAINIIPLLATRVLGWEVASLPVFMVVSAPLSALAYFCIGALIGWLRGKRAKMS